MFLGFGVRCGIEGVGYYPSEFCVLGCWRIVCSRNGLRPAQRSYAQSRSRQVEDSAVQQGRKQWRRGCEIRDVGCEMRMGEMSVTAKQ